MQFGQMEFEVLLPDVAIVESGLYGIRQVQVLILLKQHAAEEKVEVRVRRDISGRQVFISFLSSAMG